jgi:hypothetical protein
MRRFDEARVAGAGCRVPGAGWRVVSRWRPRLWSSDARLERASSARVARSKGSCRSRPRSLLARVRRPKVV